MIRFSLFDGYFCADGWVYFGVRMILGLKPFTVGSLRGFG
jgi:hypothetical protein